MGPRLTAARRHKLIVRSFADLKPAAEPAKASTAQPSTNAKPAPLTSKQRERIRARVAASEWLRSTWPALFRWPPRPLAVGIGKLIVEAGQAAGFERAQIHAALRFHTRGRRYHEALAAEGAMRVHLDGTPAEPVSDEHREIAARALLEGGAAIEVHERTG
jgi:sRNA-binding protein